MHVLPTIAVVACLQVVIKGDGEIPSDFFHFPNLEAIKSYFRDEKHPYAKRILETFEHRCIFTEVSNKTRKPFIVIEGNHRGSRDIIGKKLAQRLKAKYMTNLAPCLFELFSYLSHGSLIRRIFYLLSIYAVASEAQYVLNMGQAVVVNGYWWEQVTFSLLRSLKGAPPPSTSHHIFTNPSDLLQPDLTIFVDLPDTTDTDRKSSHVKERSLDIYKNLSARYPIMIFPVLDIYKGAIDQVYSSVRQNLSDQRDFGFSPWASLQTTTPGDLE